jgi:sensor histidine kinase YesM
MQNTGSNRGKSVLRAVAIWGSLILIFTAYAYLEYLSYGVEIPLTRTLAWETIGWSLWGILTPLIFAVAKRYPPQKHLLLQFGIAILFATTHFALHFGLFSVAEKFLVLPEKDFHLQPVSKIAWRLVVYSIILLVWYAIESQKLARSEEKRVSELSAQLSRAQLQALKMQLHPHFLFNTLNAISELMHQDIRAADEMMVRLGDFLRLTLDPSISQEVTLEKELEFLKHYLEIEQVRFKDRLKIEMNIDPETTKARVPYLVLQPVVENAIRHGISGKAEGGTIQISSEKENGFLSISVQDDGNGFTERETSMKTGGVGLANTRSRLEKMYGDRFQLELSHLPGAGTSVRLTIPFIKDPLQ